MSSFYHLIGELYGCHESLLTDKTHFEATINQVILITEMTLIGQPHIHRFTPNNGITAFAVLGESHLSFHSYPETRTIAFDLYSCKPFKQDQVFDLIASCFRGKGSYRLLHRPNLYLSYVQ